jgi:hypothetical protein
MRIRQKYEHFWTVHLLQRNNSSASFDSFHRRLRLRLRRFVVHLLPFLLLLGLSDALTAPQINQARKREAVRTFFFSDSCGVCLLALHRTGSRKESDPIFATNCKVLLPSSVLPWFPVLVLFLLNKEKKRKHRRGHCSVWIDSPF